MISNQVLQNTLEGLKEISRTEFCVIDTDGKVLASTFSDFEIQPADIQAFVESQADSQLVKGFQYFKVCDDYQLEYVLVAHGDDEDTYMVGKLAAFQIQNLIVAYKERFDKDSFIKNLLLETIHEITITLIQVIQFSSPALLVLNESTSHGFLLLQLLSHLL